MHARAHVTFTTVRVTVVAINRRRVKASSGPRETSVGSSGISFVCRRRNERWGIGFAAGGDGRRRSGRRKRIRAKTVKRTAARCVLVDDGPDGGEVDYANVCAAFYSLTSRSNYLAYPDRGPR